MKPFVFIALLVALVGGGYWSYRQWAGPSAETPAREAEEAVRVPAVAPEARSQAAVPAEGTLPPGELPGPRDSAPFTPPVPGAAGSAAAQVGGGKEPPRNPDLDENGLPKQENYGPDGRFDSGAPPPPPPVNADGRDNPDPFPEPPSGLPETDAFSDLPPPPPPRMAEDGADDGGSPSFPGDPAFSDSESF